MYHTTGFTPPLAAELYDVLNAAYPATKQTTGRPAALTREQEMRIAIIYKRRNRTEHELAETFAVWLTQGAFWQERYVGWPAVKKLEYVDGLMQSLRGRKALVDAPTEMEPLTKARRTLRQHYRHKRRHYGVERPSFYDRELQALRVVSWNGATYRVETVDATGDMGQYLALGANGSVLHVAYYDATNQDLKYAWRGADGWHITTVDSAGDAGKYVALALDKRCATCSLLQRCGARVEIRVS